MKAPAWSLALAAVAALCGASPARADSPGHLGPRANYLERCGGCHGVEGASFARSVPDLKDKAGWFLCDRAGRDYVARLPNVVFAEISDTDMAAMLNYVMFGLGAQSAPPHAATFSAREVARTRRNALTIPDLEAYRARIVDGLIANCGAPASLRTEYGAVAEPKARAGK